MEEIFATNGKVIEEKIADFQKVYDFFGARCTSCPDEPLWNVDAEALRTW